ncbi:MAG: hypothetical protein IJB66_05165 [Oscillospiraceae bacterium]|nr:hypothetical protein [Oscillospiraceae bacterium]
MIKRFFALLLAIVVFGAFPVFAFGHEVPDPERKGSVTVTVTYNGEPVPGGTLTIYKVGNVVSDDGNYGFAFTEDFAECPVSIDEIGSSELPAALAKIAAKKDIDGITGWIDHRGKVSFTDLEIGLYLAVQGRAAAGFGKINPFLISVPYYDGESYIYDVDASPKIDLKPKPEEPDDPKDPPDKPDDELPDTGLMNWPVPVMAVSGAVLIGVGIILRRVERKMR